jgi:hypothetical protein
VALRTYLTCLTEFVVLSKSDVHAELRPCLCQSLRDFLVEFSETLREFSEFSEFSRIHREHPYWLTVTALRRNDFTIPSNILHMPSPANIV